MPTLAPPQFLDDWRDMLRTQLARLGFRDANTVETVDHRPLERIYFVATERLIEQRPRRVHEPKGFRVEGHLRKKYYALRHKIKQGEELRPHQSQLILSAQARDDLLSDWGLQHLHLGRVRQENGLVERTEPILLCLFHPDDAYVVALEAHGFEHPALWGDTRHLNLVAQSWPHLLRPYEVGIPPEAASNPSPREVVTARKASSPLYITLANGKTYAPPGGGVHPDGSWRGVALAEQWILRIAQAQAVAVSEFEQFVEAAKQQYVALPDTVRFRLHVAAKLWGRLEKTNYVWCLEPAVPAVVVNLKAV